MKKVMVHRDSSCYSRRGFGLVSLCFLLTSFFFLLFDSAAHATTYVSGTISQNTTWTTAGSPYVSTGVTVAPGVTLTIQPGVVVKTNTLNYSSITVNGTLNASGAVFTSFKDDSYGGDTNGDGSATSPAAGDWKGIWFSGGGSLSGCTIIWGGYYTGASGMVSVAGTAPVSISGSTISHSASYGIYVYSGATAPNVTGSTVSDNAWEGIKSLVSFSSLSGNSFTGNGTSAGSGRAALIIPATIGAGVYSNTYSGNGKNAMEVTGHVTQNTTWPASNSPYLVDGVNGSSMDISAGVTLTIPAGTVVKPLASLSGTSHMNTNVQINVSGTLNASGAVFTSFFDDGYGGDTNGDGAATGPLPGDWRNIAFSPGSSGSITGSIIRYGGSMLSGRAWGEIFIDGSAPTITGSSISHSLNSGIYFYSASTAYIHYNDIFTNANGYYGIKNAATTGIDATNNWWGGIGGPKPYGTGNAISSNVTASPWSDVPFTQAGAEAQAMGTDTWCGAYGEPVNTSTGAFYYAHSDIEIPTRGLPLNFERTYNSNNISDGPLGYGWSHNWQMSANPRQNGDVVILRGDGRRDTFIKNPDNSYSAPAGRHDTLIKNANGTYSLTTREQTTYDFNAENRLASVVSETGQATALTYDANKRLITITEPAGRTLNLAYNTANRIDHITDQQSHTVNFGYSASGDLTSVTDQNAGVTNFAQDSNHHITSITDPNGHTFVNNIYDAQGRVDNQTDADGNLITFDYSVPGRTSMTTHMDPNDPSRDETTVHYFDAALRLIRESDPYGKDTLFTYDAQGNRDSVTDRRGVVTSQSFDSAGNIADLYKAQGRPEEQHTHVTYNAKNHPLTRTDARGQTTSYTYDAMGSYLVQISYPQVTNYDNTFSNYSESFTYNANGTVATSTDRNGDVTAYTYDSFGNPDLVTKNTNRPAPDQVTLNYDFDSLGRKTRQVDGNGKTTTYEYNAIGDLRYMRTQVTNPDTGLPEDVVTEYQYDANGNKTVMIDPEGKTTSYSYTPMDNLSLVTDAKLNTIEHSYDAAYNRTATKDRNGNWNHFGFDKNNRLTSTTDPENNTTSFTVDEEGNQLSVTDPLGRTITQTFDGLGRVTSTTEPDEGGATRITSYTYDDADNITATTDPAGHTYSQVYDELSRLKAASDPLTNAVSYRYDGVGNRTKSRDQRNYETSFSYSPNDLLTAVTDPQNSVTGYAYDKNGNRTSQTDAEGHVTLYSYDELNRLTNEKVDAGQGNWLLEKSYQYDKSGNLTKDITGEGTISYTYDNDYSVTGITDRQSATYSFTYDGNQKQLTAVENATNKTVSFAYNPRGLLSQSTDAHGASESFTYDGAGNLTQRDDSIAGNNFTTIFDHTPRNQVKSVTRGADTSSFSFDAAGNLASRNYPNGVTTSFAYDADNRLTSQQAVKDAQTIQSFSQSFDAAGNITELTENGSLVTSYGYDALNRLYYEDISGFGEIIYGYDRVGNRLSLEHPTLGQTTYSYNQANQLIQQVNWPDPTNFTYDANGALTQKTKGADITTYSYNGMDKLTSVETPTTTIDYAYDALGRRIKRSEGSGSKNFHLSGKSDLEDYRTNQNGDLTASMQRGPDGMFLYTNYSGGQSYGYQLPNPHGDNTLITDETGSQVYSDHYDSFGNSIIGGDLGYGYTGKWQRDTDYATGTIRMGVREYDPVVGRFTSADPLKGDANSPQTINRYGYALNNPMTTYDLNGLTPEILKKIFGFDSDIGNNSAENPSLNFSEGYNMNERTGSDINGPGACDEIGDSFWAQQEASMRAWLDILGIGPGSYYSIGGDRPDEDGELSLSEAIYWYRYGHKQSLTVDLSKIDLRGISASDFPGGPGTTQTINLLTHGNISQGLVYGRLDFTYLGDRRVIVDPNAFNFDKPGIGTSIGKVVAGNGCPYLIYFQGEGTMGR